jgi:hypothetical protein
LRERTKVISIESDEYQIGRFRADVGTYILMKLMGIVIKMTAEAQRESGPTSAPVQVQQPDPEEVARMVCSSAFLGSLDLEMHRFVVAESLKLCSHREREVWMPVATAAGDVAVPQVKDDLTVTMRLVMEALAFNFADFFAQGGMAVFAPAKA